MAVLTQVHVAWIDYSSQQAQFKLVSELSGVEQRILEHTRNAAAASAQGKLSEIRAATSALMSSLRLYQSYSALQGAYGQMLATLGIDPLPAGIAGTDLHSIETALRSAPQRQVAGVASETPAGALDTQPARDQAASADTAAAASVAPPAGDNRASENKASENTASENTATGNTGSEQTAGAQAAAGQAAASQTAASQTAAAPPAAARP
jgi:hypothetical protein